MAKKDKKDSPVPAEESKTINETRIENGLKPISGGDKPLEKLD